MTPEQKTAILELADRLATQDNHGTAAPLAFNVMRPVGNYASTEDDAGNGAVFGYMIDCHFYTKAEARKQYREDKKAGGAEAWNDWLKYHQATGLWRYEKDERYEHCGDFLTQQGAQDFIDANRHHCGDRAYVYCNHAWRNREMLLAVQMPAIIKELLQGEINGAAA